MNPLAANESFTDMSFPLAGIDVSMPFCEQPARQMPNGEWARTCREGQNVRGHDLSANRRRGGQRAGLTKFFPSPIDSGWIVQHVDVLVGIGYSPPGTSGMQLSQSGRIVSLVAVSKGQVYVASPGDTTWSTTTNGTNPVHDPPLNYTGIMQSTVLNERLWFADGVNWIKYEPHRNTVFTWEASNGTLPVDTLGNAPRLICTWRGRIVLSGLVNDPHNWFMSAVSRPGDFDYAPLYISPTQAVAGNNSPMGLIGDVITSLIPYNDDVLIVGGDHTIHLISGDPMAGGQIDLVTDAIGMAWGQAWCKDPYGNVFFMSNRTGIYALVPGQQPQRISQQIEQLLQAYNTGTNTVRMFWNDEFQGLHVFISPTLQPGTTTHFFYEVRTGAWWTDQFANTNHDPLCGCVFDGNLPGDRAVIIGSWDGYVRTFSTAATNDDGSTISSYVVIGPLATKDLDEILLKDLQAVLGTTSGSITYAVYVGATAEAALATTAVATGTWSAGRNLNTNIRRSGHACYVKLTATNNWSMEVIRARIAGTGKVRRRGY